jgi:hypothetical protein
MGTHSIVELGIGVFKGGFSDVEERITFLVRRLASIPIKSSFFPPPSSIVVCRHVLMK